ncbi:hypothetical protein KBY58_04615 [Cyanobium sp. HWJ4-Hawea]|nr:hypothetical protein [Cyanobium sp. HWJ4-Hawea]
MLVSILVLSTGLSAFAYSANAADGYWLDQYNAVLFMGLFRLDTELEDMKQKGAAVVMVHADSLPDPLLRWIAWRANRTKLMPVAWIQRPTAANLARVGQVAGYRALQVDDHFFARPPVSLANLRSQLGGRQLWCSFQPGQYSWRAARHCDHVDLQLYRQSCATTVDLVYRLGIAGRRDTAVAVYHDGSVSDDRRLACYRRRVAAIGNRLFVFKWKNPEHWFTVIPRGLREGLSRLRHS